jgi:hypothetical protein
MHMRKVVAKVAIATLLLFFVGALAPCQVAFRAGAANSLDAQLRVETVAAGNAGQFVSVLSYDPSLFPPMPSLRGPHHVPPAWIQTPRTTAAATRPCG